MLCNKESIILKKILIKENTVHYSFEVSKELDKYFNTNEMFITYNKKIELDDIPISILVIPFVSSIIPIMWLTDSIMWIEEIDKTFYQSLSRIKDAYQEIYDSYPLKGSMIPAKIIDNDMEIKRKSLILFSGGLDAQTTYLRCCNSDPILCNIQGWYKSTVNEENKVAHQEIENIKNFCEKESKVFCYVKSNFATIINNNYFNKHIKKRLKDSWWHGFQHSMAFISIAIPICYYFKIKTIYIASSFSIGDKGRCASYPTTDSEFAFASKGVVVHDGFELSRQDKLKYIIDFQKKIRKPYPLKVCSFNEDNCLVCEKCVRTILGIVAENGNIKNFGFKIEIPLIEHFKKIFKNNIVFFDVEGESKKHWGYIKKRMKENYDKIEEKELVDWFLNEDLIKMRKKKIFEYRLRNFFKLLKKRLMKES